jgi:uncharacterized protein
MTAPDSLIDCDVHLPAPTPGTLLQEMAPHWREYFKAGTFQGTASLINSIYPPGAPTTSSDEVRAATSAQPGLRLVGMRDKADGIRSSGDAYFALLRENVLDQPGLEAAVANCYTALEGVRHPYLAADLATATNDWVAREWLARDPRLKGSIAVPVLFPEAAAKEVGRLAADAGFVQVLLPARSPEPYGTRRYWPIFAAAAEHGLVVALHFGGVVGIPPTSSGWPSYYIEEFVGMAQVFQAQVMSLLISGVFEEYPDLRISLCEGGFTWLPTLMWHLDKRWKGLRRDVPWVRREPSAYLRERVRATIQPVDAPPSPEPLLDIVSALGSDDFLLYASDFPHVHATAADEFVALLPANLRANVRSRTARSFYPRLTPQPALSR